MNTIPTFSELEIDKTDKDDIYQEMAKKASELLKDKNGNPLLQVKIKGNGHGFYWSPSKNVCSKRRRILLYIMEKGSKGSMLPLYASFFFRWYSYLC